LEASKEVGSHMKINDIKIGGKTFIVKFIDGLGDYGSTDFDTQTILIRNGMTEENKLSTLIHEILEVLNDTYNLELKHQTIQTLEAGLFQIYQDNF
jgi:hypothetical protein